MGTRYRIDSISAGRDAAAMARLARVVAPGVEAHRRYARQVNFHERWRGCLRQGRFASVTMDEPCLLANEPA